MEGTIGGELSSQGSAPRVGDDGRVLALLGPLLLACEAQAEPGAVGSCEWKPDGVAEPGV